MNPYTISADNQQRAPKAPFRPREFRRLLSLVRPHRRALALGLIATIAFAGFHTVSIGGAFPVFKILLEEEGLHGWVNRIVAGDRLGVEFAPSTDAQTVRLAKVHSDSSLHAAGLQAGDHLGNAQGSDTAKLLQMLASVSTGEAVPAFAISSGNRQLVTLHPLEPRREMRLLRWVDSLLPVGAEQTKLTTLIYVLAVVVAVVIVANVFRYFGEVLIATAILRAMMDLRAQLYERTLRLPMVYFSGKPTSDLVTRFVQDIQEIQRGLITFFGKFIREPLRAVFILGWALVLDWRITLTMTVAAPLVVAVFWWVGRKAKSASRKLLQAYGTMIDALTTTLHNLRVVKAYTAEEHEEQRLDQVDRSMFRQQLKLAKLEAFVSPMMETLAVVAGSFVTVWLLSRVLNHDLSLAKFVTLGVTLSVLFDPLRKLSDVYVRIQRSTAGAERIFQVLDHPIESDLHKGGVELGPLQSAIEYAGVSFTYPGAGQPALRSVNLTIRKGETLAIVGPNGCGKTTLVSMLPRLFEPDDGRVCYDGTEIRQANLGSLRAQIGMVSQDAVVFTGTPAENIVYGRSSSENGRVEDAARRASADEFIREIPGGYQAALGERGTTLSGGQRQRLAIARAVFRDAPILIFDEATSQIDSESEVKIQTALRALSRGRTTIIIAHRLSTIQFADRIVVMDAGRILDEGTHAELLPRCLLYRTLCETQFVNTPI